MIRKVVLPAFALLGALVALLVVYLSTRTTPPPPIIFPPPRSPYPYAISGAGLIEASTTNIVLGSPFDEVVDKIFVSVGDDVKKGDLIFQLDLRAFEAAANLARAQVEQAQVALESARVQFSFYERLQDKSAVSEQSYEQAYFNYLEAEENVRVAQANLQVAETNIARAIIRAPMDGQILQVNVVAGAIANVTVPLLPGATSLIESNGALVVMGSVNPMQVRIDVDEDDSWRYLPGAAATAFLRGNSYINVPLRFKYVEPYVVPKSSFTGQTIERIDTRVLQVIYEFDKGDLPLHPGQMVDVFIEAEPLKHYIPHAQSTGKS